MAFQYLWLKILHALVQSPGSMSSERLRAELARLGFSLSKAELDDSIHKLRNQGLVEVLVLAGGGSAFESVRVTASGERKIRNIVRF